MIGYVYKWVHEDRPDEVLYVGSTFDLMQRYNKHVQLFRGVGPLGPFQRHVHEERFDIDDMHMVVLEKYDGLEKKELVKKEREYQDKLKPCFGYRSTITKEEKTEQTKIAHQKNYARRMAKERT